MKTHFLFRKIIGSITSSFYPGFSSCYRCNRKWPIAKAHSTPYGKSQKMKIVVEPPELESIFESASYSKGCFPLCEDCWGELTPVQRIPYYRSLFEDWMKFDVDLERWPDIERAVLSGL